MWFSVTLTVSVVAEPSDQATPAPATQPATQPTTQPQAINTKGPVSGDDVDPDTQTITYKGQTIGFCCDDCIKKFKKDPDKYMKNLK